MELFVLLTVTVEVVVAITFSVAQTSWITIHGARMTVIVEVTNVDSTGVLSLLIRFFEEIELKTMITLQQFMAFSPVSLFSCIIDGSFQ